MSIVDISERERLQNDPMCGLTTGGREECWWSCTIRRAEHQSNPGLVFQFIVNPSCLAQCFPPDHCLNSLLEDYQTAGGVCSGSYLDRFYPELYPVSDQSCELHDPPEDSHVKRGLCSNRTEELLRDQESCIQPIWRQKSTIYSTISYIIRSLCQQDIFNDFVLDSTETNSENKTP